MKYRMYVRYKGGFYMTINEMKEKKKEKGYTYAQMSVLSGVPLGTIQKIFSGETESPRYDTLQALEQLFSEKSTVCEEASYQADRNGSYTLDDYYALPDEQRVELIDGYFYDMSAPTFHHQSIGGEIHRQIANYILEHKGSCRPFIPMEYTEPATAEMLSRNKTEICYVESNNGGRSFGRNVEAQCRIIGNNFTSFNPFTQTANKRVRIFTRSNEVQNLIYFPTGWEHKWPEFASHVKSYRKQQEFNSHDDAEDALTGVIEKRGYFNNEEDLDKEDLGIW